MTRALTVLAATCLAAPLVAQSIDDGATRNLAAHYKLLGYSVSDSLVEAEALSACLDEEDLQRISELDDPASAGVVLAFLPVETITCSVDARRPI